MRKLLSFFSILTPTGLFFNTYKSMCFSKQQECATINEEIQQRSMNDEI